MASGDGSAMTVATGPADTAPPIDAGVSSDSTFAQPPAPVDAGVAATVGTATIKGTILRSSGGSFGYLTVYLLGVQNGLRRQAQTDANGRYELATLPAGDYIVRIQQAPSNPHHNRPPPTDRRVTLTDKQTLRVDMTIVEYVEPPDTGPCCKPYGAPPARGRVV